MNLIRVILASVILANFSRVLGTSSGVASQTSPSHLVGVNSKSSSQKKARDEGDIGELLMELATKRNSSIRGKAYRTTSFPSNRTFQPSMHSTHVISHDVYSKSSAGQTASEGTSNYKIDEGKTCSQQLGMGIGVWNMFSEDNLDSVFCDGSELDDEKQRKWFPYLRCQKSNCEGCPMEYLPVVSPSCYSKLEASGTAVPSEAEPVHLNRYVYKPVGEALIPPPKIPNIKIVLLIGDSVDRKVVESYCRALSIDITVWSVDKSSKEKGFENSAICIPNDDDHGVLRVANLFLPGVHLTGPFYHDFPLVNVTDKLQLFQSRFGKPDVIVIQSLFWDIARLRGTNNADDIELFDHFHEHPYLDRRNAFLQEWKTNASHILGEIRYQMGPETKIIWRTANHVHPESIYMTVAHNVKPSLWWYAQPSVPFLVTLIYHKAIEMVESKSDVQLFDMMKIVSRLQARHYLEDPIHPTGAVLLEFLNLILNSVVVDL